MWRPSLDRASIDRQPPPIATARVPAGSRIYAVGDIHGRDDLLERLLAGIAADAATSPPPRLAVIFLGDLIDRGPDSRGVVERVAAGPPAQGPLAEAEWVVLCGNHEDYLLNFLADTRAGPSWFKNGGLETVRSYADDAVIAAAEGDLAALQMALLRALPRPHLRFLSGLPVSHVEGDYFFVHAGVRPKVALADQDPVDMMWIRTPFLASDENFGKVVVHGHSVVATPEIRPNRIAIDTGAWRSGQLTALVLEGGERRFLEAKERG